MEEAGETNSLTYQLLKATVVGNPIAGAIIGFLISLLINIYFIWLVKAYVKWANECEDGGMKVNM